MACRCELGELTATTIRPAESSVGETAIRGESARARLSEPSRSSASRQITAGIDLGHRYQIVRQLGEGGMGEVFLARDRELERDVALKVIRVDLSVNPTILERFKREIQLSSTITHKNILRVYDLGEADSVKFLTMEYIAGHDLASHMRRHGPLPLARVIDIFRQICEGLQAAHDKGVIHRDLKPQNVLVDDHGRVAIADFGLAKSLEYASLTGTGQVIGTPYYMSPEQVKGLDLDERSDIYSLGVMLYEMLTGSLPFTGNSAYEIMVQRTQRTPRPASDLNPKIPAYLLKILDKCLQVDSKLRYASTAEILHDLDTQSFHSSLSYRLRRRGRFSAAAAAVAGILLLGIALMGWRATQSSKQRAAEAAHKPVSVLVADIENRTEDAVFDGTLEPVVTLALEGASFVNAFSRASAHKAAAQIQPNSTSLDERLARLVATREGVNVVVAGAITRGQSYELALRAIDSATGKPLGQSQVTAKTKDQVLAAVGRAAADLRKALGDTTPMSVQLAAAETFTAGSLEAAHQYALGRDLFWRGKFEEAAQHYEQTVKLDPEMGRAWASLATVHANLGRKDDAEREFKLAMSHIDRMTEREKYRTRLSYYLLAHDNTRAIEEATQLLKQYPVDMNGLNNLPFAYFNSRDMQRALQESQRAIALYPENFVARNNAAFYAIYAGDFPVAIKQAQTVLTKNPSYLKAFIVIALSQLAQNDVSGASATYQQLAALSASGRSMADMGRADVALYEGSSDEGAAIFRDAIGRDRAEKRSDAANRKAATLAAFTHDTAALAELMKIETHDQHILYTVARGWIEAGKQASALEIAARLEGQLEPELQHYGKLIEGEVALSRGQPRDAIAKFEQARQLADSWLVRFDRGRAYLDAGAFTEAYADFGTCARRRGEASAIFLDDVPTFHYFPPVYYYLGRAQEGLGSKSATDSYKQFLAMKTKADGDPLVADARRRLTSIE